MINIQPGQRLITLQQIIFMILMIPFLAKIAWGETVTSQLSTTIATEEAALQILPDTIIDPENISGVAVSGDFLILGSDEGAAIQVLKKQSQNTYLSDKDQRIILDDSGEEVDIEGIAAGEEYIYVVGSHSRKRQKVKKNKSLKKNKKRLATVKTEPSREQLFRLKLDQNGQLLEESIQQITLRDIFKSHPVLALFQPIPSKENGIDIEGIAINEKQGEVYLGFRSPVLRGNFTPIMVLTFTNGKFKKKNIKHELRYLSLGGRGVRGMTQLSNAFLILGGPVGGQPMSYMLYYWDGKDMLPGKDHPEAATHIKQLCEIPLPDSKAKAEGIEFLKQENGKVYVLVVYDGEKNGGGKIFSCSL